MFSLPGGRHSYKQDCACSAARHSSRLRLYHVLYMQMFEVLLCIVGNPRLRPLLAPVTQQLAYTTIKYMQVGSEGTLNQSIKSQSCFGVQPAVWTSMAHTCIRFKPWVSKERYNCLIFFQCSFIHMHVVIFRSHTGPHVQKGLQILLGTVYPCYLHTIKSGTTTTHMSLIFATCVCTWSFDS